VFFQRSVLDNFLFRHLNCIESMILVRKATFSDSEAIAACLFLAMEDIIYRFIGENDPGKAAEFMLHLVRQHDNQYSYQNCWIAEDDMKVVAAINLYDGALLSELRKPVIDHLREKFNKEFTFDDETQAGEYYIDSLGVDPGRQGTGFGTRLLQFIIDEYVNKHRHTLGLLVEEINPNAKRLYMKLGFSSAGRKVLFGKNLGTSSNQTRSFDLTPQHQRLKQKRERTPKWGALASEKSL
jgi:ribosomal protein S18 acetylase RimI-like enzyme